MKNRYRNSIKILLLLCLPMGAFAQDYHFSNYDAMIPLNQPALTGQFTKFKYRAASQYRNQWRPLSNKPFTTFGMSYEMPFNERIGLGGYFTNFDGAKAYNAFNIMLSAAYQITDPYQKDHLLTVGVQAGATYKNINNEDLLFESQYDDGRFNSALPSNENFDKFSKLSPEINIGAYYEWTDIGNQFHPYFGVSVFHVNSPKQSLLGNANNDSRLPRRYFINPGVKMDVNTQLEIDLRGMYQYQGKAKELMIGVNGNYHIERTNTKVHLGVSYRNKDAVIVMTGVTYEELLFAINYDITTSTLNDFNGGKGALELSLVYRPRKR